MIRDYLGDWSSGRLGGKRFAFLYAVAVVVTVAAMMLVVGGAAGFSVMASDPDAVAQALGTPLMALWLLWLVLVAVALCNIVAKRGRDIGFPGWASVLAFLIVGAIGRGAGDGGGVLTLLFAIVLALIPSGRFDRARAA